MRFAVVAAGLATAVAAQNGTASDVWVTDVVTAFTTFCPEATMLTHGGKTYTASASETVTITNCPGGCTISKPAYSSVVTSCSTCSTEAPMTSSAVAAAGSSSMLTSSAAVAPVSAAPLVSAAPYPSSNGTNVVAPAGTAAPSGSTTGSSASSPSQYTGAASQVSAVGAGFLAMFGLVALL